MISLGIGLLTNKWFAGGLAAVGIFIAIWSSAFYRGKASVDVAGIERMAFAKGQIARDAEWAQKLALAEREKDAEIAEWQRKAEEAEAEAPTPATAPELAALCAKDALCRK